MYLTVLCKYNKPSTHAHQNILYNHAKYGNVHHHAHIYTTHTEKQKQTTSPSSESVYYRYIADFFGHNEHCMHVQADSIYILRSNMHKLITQHHAYTFNTLMHCAACINTALDTVRFISVRVS